MSRLRRRLSWVFAGWLLCQSAAIAAPLAIAAKSAIDDICGCPTGEGATCPMHHKQASNSESKSHRLLQTACMPTDVGLLSLASGTGAQLPEPFVLTPFQHVSAAVAAPASQSVSRIDIPDSPPPRS